jgi:hypothetical protein
MVFKNTFNNISAISWWPFLLVEETGIPGENHFILNFEFRAKIGLKKLCSVHICKYCFKNYFY